MLNYDPLIISFIINVVPKKLKQIKPYLIDAITPLQIDDLCYLYSEGDYNICSKRGKVISKIANFKPNQSFRLEKAIKQTIYMLRQEDTDFKKYIFIVVDDSLKEYEFKKGLFLNNKENLNCNFIVCDVGNTSNVEKTCEHLECKYLKIEDVNQLGNKIYQIYSPTTTFDDEFKTKYGKSPMKARIELKEKYAKDISSKTSAEITN